MAAIVPSELEDTDTKAHGAGHRLAVRRGMQRFLESLSTYSRRRLTQLLTAETGHGPKTVQRLARFDTARRHVAARASAGSSLADVAALAGYYDQSHLVRDFREFAGLGPSAWLAAEFPNVQAAPADVAAASRP